MRFVRTLVVCSLLAAAVASTGPTPAAASSPEAEVVASINRIREDRGLKPLRASASLRRSSRRYAAWMLRHDHFGHRSTIVASGRFRRLGEAIGMTGGWRPRWRTVVRMWLRSSEHCRILLSRHFEWIGVGESSGRLGRRRATTWVAQVGRT